ncbi:MAG: FkbM family methyltransferase, partial [Oscillospiraceae bacterium]
MIKEDLWTYLKRQSKPIYIYGMGDGAQKIITALNKYGISIKGIYASDNYLRKDTFMGFDVVRRCMVADEDYITLLAFATFNEDMLNDFYNYPTEMYAPDVPVAKTDDRFFDMEYAKKYKSELTFVYDMLADEQSKKVFENVIYFKLTGKVSYLKDITT